MKSLGGDGVTTASARTAEQTEIGLFWIESSPLAWNRIARQISARANLDLHANARLFGLLNMAMADGYIGSWEGKYHYKFWRPITAIRDGDSDGNPDTAGDPTGRRWDSPIPCPTTTRPTASRAARRPRSSNGSLAPTAFASGTAA